MISVQQLSRPGGGGVRFVADSEPWPSPRELDEHGIRVFDVESSSITNDHDLFRALATALEFPDYFGHNWDALDECLRDMEWLPAKGYVLRFRHAERLWAQAPTTAGKMVESAVFVNAEWVRFGAAFHTFFVWGPEVAQAR